MRKPILCLDFDGVLHSYISGWRGANVIPDDPVPGALAFLKAAVDRFEVHIFSSRSHQDGGVAAMQDWIARHVRDSELHDATYWWEQAKYPLNKPPALVTIDDRAIQFTGEWPSLDEISNFKPWNKRSA